VKISGAKYITMMLGLFVMCQDRQNIPDPCMPADKPVLTGDMVGETMGKSYQLFKDKLMQGQKADEDFLIQIYDEFIVYRNQKQILGVAPCPDSPLCTIFLFYSDNIPETIALKYQGLGSHSGLGNLRISDGRKFVQKKIEFAEQIDLKYFSTNKGIKLGMKSSDVVKVYGPPQAKGAIKTPPKTIRYSWESYGKSEAEFLTNVPKEKVCPSMDWGQHIYVDFQQSKIGEKAIFINIRDKAPSF